MAGLAVPSVGISWLPFRTVAGILRQRLTRITASTTYIAEIDGLRFLAILGVVVYHLPIALRFAPLPRFAMPWVVSGQLGVQLFFIISGFVLALPFAKSALRGGRPVGLKAYFLRRLTRIEPPYLLSLTAMYFLHIFFACGVLGWGHLLAGTLYLHTMHYGYSNPINPVTWSLEVEVQFYLLVPLLAAVFTLPLRTRRSVLVLSVLLSLLLNCVCDSVLHGRADMLQWTIAGYLHFFLIGFLFADLYLCSGLLHSGHDWDVLALIAGLTIVYGHIHPDNYLGETTSAFGLTAIFAAAFLGRWSRMFLRAPWIATIGGTCYSLYLLHYFILRSAGVLVAHYPILERGGLFEYAVAAMLLMPMVLILSSIFFVLVERPCMDPAWPRKLMDAVRGLRLAGAGTPESGKV